MDRNILDDGLYNNQKNKVRTTKINFIEQIALIGSGIMVIVSIYYMYIYMPNYYNITSFISETIVFVTILYWSKSTKNFDNSFSNKQFHLLPFVRMLKVFFVLSVCGMLYKFISSLSFLFYILVNLDFETSGHFILLTLVDGVLVSFYTYYLVWIFKTEKQMLSINKEKSGKSFFIK